MLPFLGFYDSNYGVPTLVIFQPLEVVLSNDTFELFYIYFQFTANIQIPYDKVLVYIQVC